ncbi:hypothetical protein BK816_07575 [Boudabousia tangfeifanii]|uniref:Lipoprotein n=1 Tax=Boudabousia tangfeifanii TaxID=1912795 RepID=A0A1D9MLZ9_9ACTO|nr:hypothetical protein [Boudabousia tangfeifanii]AOZ73170.1 hypothetical protein BK816_07575 [Boudabousia tangfeifanii]
MTRMKRLRTRLAALGAICVLATSLTACSSTPTNLAVTPEAGTASAEPMVFPTGKELFNKAMEFAQSKSKPYLLLTEVSESPVSVTAPDDSHEIDLVTGCVNQRGVDAHLEVTISQNMGDHLQTIASTRVSCGTRFNLSTMPSSASKNGGKLIVHMVPPNGNGSFFVALMPGNVVLNGN